MNFTEIRRFYLLKIIKNISSLLFSASPLSSLCIVKNLYKPPLKTRGFPNKFSLALKNVKIRHFRRFRAKVLIIKCLSRFLVKIAVLEVQKSPVKLQRRLR